MDDAAKAPWKAKAATAKATRNKSLEKYMKTSDYEDYITARDQYKADMIAKRNKLMGVKKRGRSKTTDNPTEAKKPKMPKKRSTSVRRASTPKAPKRSRRRSKGRRAVRRRAKARRAESGGLLA